MMRDRAGTIIYVGKAKNLSRRVRSYFRHSTILRGHPKVRQLVREAESVEWQVVSSEDEALLLENRLINGHKPKYNILLKDDKRYLGICATVRDAVPALSPYRLRRDDGALYFGPFPTIGSSLHLAIDYLQRRFGLRRCNHPNPGSEAYSHCNNDLLCTCSAPCAGKVSAQEYRQGFEEACDVLRGKRLDVVTEAKKKMEEASLKMEYEKALYYREVWTSLAEIARSRKAAPAKSAAERRGEAMEGLKLLSAALNLPSPPHVIECFDISNTSGILAVASMVAAVDGIPDHRRYRIFNMEGFDGPNDPAMIAQAVSRRYSALKESGEEMPGLVVLDGGITQLRAARAALRDIGVENLPTVGIAKRMEELVLDNGSPPILLPAESEALSVIRRLRDEAHRFAITRHRKRRNGIIRASLLDDIAGIGPAKKLLLLRAFGSAANIARQDTKTIAALPSIGMALAEEILRKLEKLR